MVKSGKAALKTYTEDQVEDLLEIQRDLIQERLRSLREEISSYPFLSMAVAFVLGFALGVALAQDLASENKLNSTANVYTDR